MIFRIETLKHHQKDEIQAFLDLSKNDVSKRYSGQDEQQNKSYFEESKVESMLVQIARCTGFDTIFEDKKEIWAEGPKIGK